jgi:hypothetical protein
MSTNKTPPHCHMLVVHPAFYLFPYILPRNPQDQFSSNKRMNSYFSCELFDNFIPMYPCMSGDPNSPTECQVEISFIAFLALLYQWGCCFGCWKGFQKCLSEQMLTYIWSFVHMNFLCTDQDSICTRVLVLTCSPS